MTKMIIELTEEEAEVWAERARLAGHASAAEALTAWVVRESEPIDPAEVELLRERMAADPETDKTLDQVVAHFETKYGVKIRRRGESS